jgi:hypothetical protein
MIGPDVEDAPFLSASPVDLWAGGLGAPEPDEFSILGAEGSSLVGIYALF